MFYMGQMSLPFRSNICWVVKRLANWPIEILESKASNRKFIGRYLKVGNIHRVYEVVRVRLHHCLRGQ